MREYETTVIIQPEISEEGSKTILDRMDGILEQSGDIRLSLEDMGKRKLAYEIRKFHKGHYYILSYLGGGKSVNPLERALRLDESVLRFMTIVANENVTDVEARKAQAVEFEQDQAKRAAEKAEREAEEAKAREEAERAATAEREAAATAAAAASEAAAEESAPAEASPEPVAEAAPTEAAPAEETAAEPASDAPASEASDEEGEKS